MNEAALEVFNTITSGVRDGWFFPIRRQQLDEVIFLQWVEELRLVLKPLGLFAEPGVYLRRRPKMVKGKTIVDAKRRLPARLVSHFVVFVAGDSESLSALSDAYYLARGAKGRMFEPDAYAIQSNEKRRRWSWPLCWAYLIRLSKTKPKVAAKC